MADNIKTGVGFIIPVASLIGFVLSILSSNYFNGIIFIVAGMIVWMLYILVVESTTPVLMGNILILFVVLLSLAVFLNYGISQNIFGGYELKSDGSLIALLVLFFGGLIGMAIAWGVKRGIYSNEAGQGTGPHMAAAAEVSHPAKQGLVQAFSVYIDTLFVCSATAFMILFTGMYNTEAPDGSFIVNNLEGIEAGPGYTQAAIDSVIPGFGAGFVAIALFFFAFTTIMAYYYIAETNIAYLIRGKNNKIPMFLLKVIILGATFYGAVKTASLAWALGDVGLGIMVWLNVIAILILAKPALLALKDYEQQKKQGKDPVFDPKALGIKNADYWETEYKKDQDQAS